MDLFECKNKPGLEITKRTCIARQKFLDTKKRRNGYERSQYLNVENLCKDCPTGLEYYELSLKGDDTMESKKTCPCGKLFARGTDQNDQSWGRVKFCPEHAAMNSYQRSKDLSRIKAGIPADPVRVVRAPEEPPVVDQTPDIEVESKTCAWEECGKEFTRRERDTDAGWRNRKYCSKGCSRLAERQRDRDRKRAHRQELNQSKVFDSDKAKENAKVAAEEALQRFAPFLVDLSVLTHDQFRAILEEAGMGSQRRMVGAA